MRANEKRTHCHRGHELTPENVITSMNWKKNLPQRKCRECDRVMRVERKVKKILEAKP